MRSFPSATRQRVAASLVGLCSITALAVPLVAHADEDDLKNRQREVENRIDDAAHALEEASADATRATRALQAAQAKLDAARAELGEVRTRLGAARERDAQLKAELAQAELELEAANAAVAVGQRAVEDQRIAVRSQVIDVYTQGDLRLRAIGSLFDAGSLQDISDGRLADEVFNTRQVNIFGDLEDVEAELTDERAEVKRTAQVVEDKRQAAAAHLDEMQVLYAEASEAKRRVEGLVVDARALRTRAFQARERDRQLLARLKAREDRIADRLRELARQQRNKAGYTGDSDGYLSVPVAGGYVTSPYGYRTHPIYGYYSLHNGIDFGASGGCGAPLLAAAGGTVIDTYYDSVYGNRLYLSIGNVNGKNLVLIYNHMSSYAAGEGDTVARGERVGLMGTTGWSTGCHLHFTVMANGVAVDPANYL